MRFAVIDPTAKTVKAIDASSFDVAIDTAGLDRMHTDHGVVERGISIVVYEWGLMRPIAEQKNFAIGGRLYEGKSLLYGYDEKGDTVDLTRIPEVTFFKDADAVEKAIEAGTINRPESNAYDWRWPQPKPKGLP